MRTPPPAMVLEHLDARQHQDWEWTTERTGFSLFCMHLLAVDFIIKALCLSNLHLVAFLHNLTFMAGKQWILALCFRFPAGIDSLLSISLVQMDSVSISRLFCLIFSLRSFCHFIVKPKQSWFSPYATRCSQAAAFTCPLLFLLTYSPWEPVLLKRLPEPHMCKKISPVRLRRGRRGPSAVSEKRRKKRKSS